MQHDSYYIKRGTGPIVASAIHSGHIIRNELKSLFNLNKEERRREEDPYTDKLASVAPSSIIGLKSRFEVDLNRARSSAVYQKPEDAWGLEVWKSPPDEVVVNRSLAIYDNFYDEVKTFLSAIIEKYGYVVVYDLHTYNHRRDGAEAPPAAQEENPDVNLGTANLNRYVWGPVIEGLTNDLKSYNFPDRQLDVRENIKFKGGHFSRWIYEEFGDRSCAIAIEFKKIFMDEWTYSYDSKQLYAIRKVLKLSLPRTLQRSRDVAKNVIGVLE